MQVDRNFWEGKKVFITGGAGFVGSHLADKVSQLGADVLVLEHVTKTKHKSIVGDITKLDEEFQNRLLEYSPDVVFHLAAQPIVNYAEELLQPTLKINIEGTYKLYFALKDIPSVHSIIHISTDKVYGDLPEITLLDIPNGIHHPYNVSKLAGDDIAQMFAYMFNMPITIIRNGNVYGDGDNHFERLIPKTFVEILRGNKPTIRGDGTMTRDYIHVNDIVIGYMNAAQHTYKMGIGDIFLLGSHKKYTTNEVVGYIQNLCKSKSNSVIYEPALRGEIWHQHIIDIHSREVLGWIPEISLFEGLKLSKHYYEDYVNERLH